MFVRYEWNGFSMTSAHFTDLASVIAAEVARAYTRIDVAVAWFTDPVLCHALTQRAQANVQVTVVVRGDNINFTPPGAGKLDWKPFLAAGGNLYISSEHSLLHHKFCVIDQQRVLSGSYNWTRAARRNLENMLVCDLSEVAGAYGQEFETLRTQANKVTDLGAVIAAAPVAVDTWQQEQTAASEVDAAPSSPPATTPYVQAYNRLVELADAAFRRKQYSEALQLAQQALPFAPQKPQAYIVLGEVHFRTERFVECVAAANEAEAHGVVDRELCNLLGLGLDGLHRYKEAVKAFDRCIAQEPTNSIWHVNKCATLKAWNRNESLKKVASDGRQAASAEIQRFKASGNNIRLVRSYIVHAYLREVPTDRKYDARAAQEVYERLPPEKRDTHDWDDIQHLLKNW